MQLERMLRKFGRGIITAGLAASLSLSCSEEIIEPTPEPEPIVIVKNNPPTFISTPVTSVNEKQNYSYQAQARDQDGDNLSYSLVKKPNWISLSGSGLISGTAPEVSNNESYEVSVAASDGKVSAYQNYNLSVQNLSNTYVLTSDQAGRLLNADGTSLYFSQAMNFAAGDIIAAGISTPTPSGLLREIVSVSSDKKTFHTDQATLEQAAKDASLSYSGKLLPSSVLSSHYLEGISMSRQAKPNFDFNISLNNVVLYDQDNDPNTKGDQLIANGNISFNTNTTFSFDINNHQITDLKFKNLTDITSDITAGFNSLGMAQTYQVKVAEYKFKPFVMGYLPTPVPIPVIIVPKLGIYVGMDPTNLNPLSVRVQQNSSLDLGLFYSGIWTSSSTFSKEFNFSNPAVNDNLELKVFGGPQMELMLYGIAGPFGAVSGRLRLKAQDGGWELYGGMGASLGVKMDVLKKKLSVQFKEIINYETLLAKSASPTLEGKILFFSGPEFGSSQIYTIKDNGSNLQQITDLPSLPWNCNPCSSPDGKKLFFVSTKDGNREIYSMNLDGSGLTRLTSNASYASNDDISPDCSPNGQEIVFASDRSGQQGDKSSEIYLMNSDGSNQRKIGALTGILEQDSPSWSPNGQKIAFDATTNGSHYNIYIVNKDGSGLNKITDTASLNTQSSWSPDGTMIAFTTDRDGNREIYVMNSDGTNQKRLTNNPTHDVDPFWLPDGRIVFISNRDGGYNNLHIMKSDGSEVKKITTKAYHYDSSPSYIPSQ